MAQAAKPFMDVIHRNKVWLQSIEICWTVLPSFVKYESPFFHEIKN